MVQEKETNFKRVEKDIYGIVHKIGREILKEILEKWDAEIHKERDRSVYRDKGKRKTVIKTLMGEVEYSRHVYIFQDEDGRRGTVYLLDKKIGREGSGFFSEALMERIASMICVSPFRETASEITELSGQSISHTAVWKSVQQMGEQVNLQEEDNAELSRKNKSQGQKEAKLLFEEQDGIWINLQGKDREEYGKSKEMKVAIAYDGAEKKGKDRYRLTGKVVCANFEEAAKFCRRKEGVIASQYKVDEIVFRVLNGDGAGWIKRSITGETIYQLDTFHRNQAIVRVVKDKEKVKHLLKLLYAKQIDEMLLCIETMADSTEDEKESKDLKELYNYFSNNKDGLILYSRRGIKLPEPEEGKVYRRGGAMESNIFSVIGNRMKGRRRNWSVSGGNNMARLLCLKEMKKLNEAAKQFAGSVSEKYAEEVITDLSGFKIKERVGKGYNGFEKAMIPPSMPWLKEIMKLKPLSELKY